MPTRSGRRPKIGLVLSGGGAAGIAHIGVLQALDRAGIVPDFVVGASMGALIGAAFCFGNDVYHMEREARLMSWKDIAPLTIPRMMGLVPSENIRRLFARHAKGDNFNDLKIPLHVIITDLKAGERLIVSEGNLADAVQASCAIPGIFTPVKRDGRILVDGGVLSNLPVDVARQMGADIVIASDVPASWTTPDQIANAMHIVAHSMFLTIKQITELAAQDADFLIRTVHPEATLTNFSLGGELIRMA
ncbi:MAG: patatin-like phospholipase family protein, partial [Candidatus Sericytochromatia bacterium]|nr:patatin-like phospholipase family protein [Candidatus Sericytochromatia bacterium]